MYYGQTRVLYDDGITRIVQYVTSFQSTTSGTASNLYPRSASNYPWAWGSSPAPAIRTAPKPKWRGLFSAPSVLRAPPRPLVAFPPKREPRVRVFTQAPATRPWPSSIRAFR